MWNFNSYHTLRWEIIFIAFVLLDKLLSWVYWNDRIFLNVLAGYIYIWMVSVYMYLEVYKVNTLFY